MKLKNQRKKSLLQERSKLMKNNIIQSEMDVKGSKINVVRVNEYEYISLTDLAKTQNDEAQQLSLKIG